MRADAASSAPVSSALTTSSSACVRSKCWRFSDLITSTHEYASGLIDSTARVVSSERASRSSGSSLAFDASASTITVDTRSMPARRRSSSLLGLPRMNVTPSSSSGSVSRSARITISRRSSTSLARSSRMISEPFGLQPQIRRWSEPLNVPIPAPRLMTVATNRDAMVAVVNATRLTPGDPHGPVRHEAELALDLVGRRALEQRAEEPAVGVADVVDVVAAAVLDQPRRRAARRAARGTTGRSR